MNRLKQLAADLMQQEQPQQPQGSWGDLTTYPYGENSKSTSNLAQILAGKEVERGMFAPLVEYGDGRIEYGVPNALMAPARAVQNMLTPGYDYSNTQQAAQDSFDAAGLIATGGLAGAGMRPAGSVGIFGGRLAKTADQGALQRAEQMAESGVPREQIWNDTGWFQGVDGQWRFEIDDSKAYLSDNATGALLGAGKYAGRDLSTNYWGAFRHPELEAAYGDSVTELVDWTVRRGRQSGSRDSDSGAIAVTAPDPQSGRSIALHELQHAGQDIEGFARGGTPDVSLTRELVAPSLQDVRARKAALKIDPYKIMNKKAAGYKLTDEESASLKKWNELNDIEDAVFAGMYEPFDAYKRLAGEVEARTVQQRMDLTPEQRRARAPWLDYDVPEDQQIVRRR